MASSLGLQGPSAPIGAQLLASSASAASTSNLTNSLINCDDDIIPSYHGNLLTGVNNTIVATLQNSNNNINSGNSGNCGGKSSNPAGFKPGTMQASAAEANSLDLQAMQSMDWLFKKERIYLLAQFWQQVSLFFIFYLNSVQNSVTGMGRQRNYGYLRPLWGEIKLVGDFQLGNLPGWKLPPSLTSYRNLNRSNSFL